MSTINRLLSRRDKHHGAHQDKVPNFTAARPVAPASASFSTIPTRASSTSIFTISLAFPKLLPKRSPRLQATLEPVHCSSADSTTLLLQPKQPAGPFKGLSVPEQKEQSEKPGNEDDRKIKTLSQRLSQRGIDTFKEDEIAYVLAGTYAQGDSEKAYELLLLLEDSEEGIIRTYNPHVKLLGAVNREGVTCYLDALLFAMFARLGSFEAMLYKNFEDPPRMRLATLLRLWVNTLRAGKLITTDITKQIQLQLSACGWKEAAQVSQQDASEAFTFITSTLALPLLTLKMDIFHTGKEDVKDDHKFVNERLLEVAVPDEPLDGHVVTLEECLEMFFNNKIEVKRYLDQLERRSTMSSVRSRQSIDSAKAHASHVEVAEIGDGSQPSSPAAIHSQPSPTSATPVRPTSQRKRAPSIIQEYYVDEKRGLRDHSPSISEEGTPTARVRKEVMMPAWQFFSLIPWYTNSVPSNDTQVAAHFSSTRPILGICLKRYSILPNGTGVKRKTRIDIPTEIGLPHFIQDDKMAEDGPAFGNFKLSLQSVVCHQGVSTESGHYLSLVRCPDLDQPGGDNWMRFDDLAQERVTHTNVETFLLQESPYLLFYQVIPIEGDPGNIAAGEPSITNGDLPPSYSESTASQESNVDSGVSGLSTSPRFSYTSNDGTTFDPQRPSIEIRRPSSDQSTSEDGRRGRSSMKSDKPQSILFSDINTSSAGSVKSDFLNAPDIAVNGSNISNTLATSRSGSRTAQTDHKGRPSSRSDEKRMSASLSRLANRMSRDKLNKTAGPPSNAATSSDGVSGSKPPSSQNMNPAAAVATNKKALAANEKSSDWGRLMKDAKEKRNESKPDRECLMM